MAEPKRAKLTEAAHALVRGVVRPGDHVVDATVGHGRDTAFLAALVGPGGKVIGFDVQAGARIDPAPGATVEVHRCGHERMREFVTGPVRAVMFNLGYLPGGDPGIVTRPETTVAALAQAAGLLAPGGIITVAVYTGHPGGREEGEAVQAFCDALDTRAFEVTRHEVAPAGAVDAPYLLAIASREVAPGLRTGVESGA